MAALLPNFKLLELKKELLEEVEKIFPNVIDAYLKTVEQKLDVAEIIRSRMAILEVNKLEKLLMSILQKEFLFVEYIGAVIGFVIGLFQLLITVYSK